MLLYGVTIFTHFTGNSLGFTFLLGLLQPQLSQDDDIYVVDSTPNRDGLKLATLFGTTRSYIFVEVGDYSYEQAFNFAFQNMAENKQDGLLAISDQCVISTTFITNLKKAIVSGFAILYPQIREIPYKRMDSNFQWFCPVTAEVVKADINDATPHCAYFAADKKYSDSGIFKNEVVVVLPSNLVSI